MKQVVIGLVGRQDIFLSEDYKFQKLIAY